MNRKAEKFFDAITLLREDLVEEAQNYVFRKKRSAWKTFGSLAACMVLVVSLGLLMLPRGCGGGAAAPDFNSSGNDACAPADTPWDGSADGRGPEGEGQPEQGDSLQGTEPLPEPSGEAPPSEAEQLQFWGQMLEVLEDGLLVEPFDGLDAERVFVPTAGLEDLPEFYPGGVVTVFYGSIVQEDGEAIVQGVTAIDLVEPESP